MYVSSKNYVITKTHHLLFCLFNYRKPVKPLPSPSEDDDVENKNMDAASVIEESPIANNDQVHRGDDGSGDSVIEVQVIEKSRKRKKRMPGQADRNAIMTESKKPRK